jgi:hypothetical protein
MITVGASLSLYIPIFNCPNYVTFIKGAEHNLNFVISLVFGIAKQKVNSAANWLAVFFAGDFQIAQT